MISFIEHLKLYFSWPVM